MRREAAVFPSPTARSAKRGASPQRTAVETKLIPSPKGREARRVRTPSERQRSAFSAVRRETATVSPAVEKVANVVVAAAEKGKEAGLPNLRFLQLGAEYLPRYKQISRTSHNTKLFLDLPV